ncbi:MAG: STAS domain-containing protein [bacterium]
MRIEKMDRGDVVILRLSGSIGYEDISTLRTTLNRLVQKGRIQFVIDCEGMDSLDSSALATFLSTYKRVKGGSMSFVHLSPHVDRVFRETHLDQVFRICPTMEEAMAGFGHP